MAQQVRSAKLHHNRAQGAGQTDTTGKRGPGPQQCRGQTRAAVQEACGPGGITPLWCPCPASACGVRPVWSHRRSGLGEKGECMGGGFRRRCCSPCLRQPKGDSAHPRALLTSSTSHLHLSPPAVNKPALLKRPTRCSPMKPKLTAKGWKNGFLMFSHRQCCANSDCDGALVPCGSAGASCRANGFAAW